MRLHNQMCADRGRFRFNVVKYRHLSRSVSKRSTAVLMQRFNRAEKIPAVNDFHQALCPRKCLAAVVPVGMRMQRYKPHFRERKF